MKILPKDSSTGSTTQYWYDRADRMAYMKDPALGSRYRFYLYDRSGRLCVQGTCSGGGQGHPILSATSQPASVLSTASYDSISAGLCNTGYTAPYAITDPQLEIVNYYDGYDFIGRNLTSAMPSVPVNDSQRTYSIGFQTGQVVFASNGGALGSVSVYDQKGQVVRSVRKGLDGLLEDVSTAYSFTGAVDTMRADVNVRYGSHFIAESAYTYRYGKKTNMKLSVSHGQTPVSRNTKYVYDAIGRLVGKERKLLGTKYSSCVYSYDVHGWLTSVKNGSFQESLYYADGLDGGCYNGNISTVKWKSGSVGFYHGYNLKYDGCNRLYSAVFGTGDDLTGNKDYFNENVQYDCNGNITRLQRGGLVDNMRGWFGLVDDLTMTYEGNLLTSVRDDASHSVYASATDFDGVCGQEYPLMYNDAGSLMSDAGRKIARIDYDCLNNPVRIQFTNGNVTKYVYSATGEKLRVIYQTAVPNISVAIGCSKELVASEILYADSTDYLLGGSLTLKNGRIDKYQFEEGYCQAVSNASQDNFTFQYYDLDHLGNVRQVLKPDGSKTGKIVQTMDYYPFGAQLCDGTTDSNVQSHRYNGKELDKMHGLNTYDYGVRQYNPVTARWDRVDPLAEKNPNMTPYHFCHNNSMNMIDPDGQDDYYTSSGQFLSRDNKETDNIIIRNQAFYEIKSMSGVEWIKPDIPIENADLSAEAYSNIFTNVLSQMRDVDTNDLHNGQVSVTIFKSSNDNIGIEIVDKYNDANNANRLADIFPDDNGKQLLTAYIHPKGSEERSIISTVSNVQNLLGAHEYLGHYKNKWHGKGSHQKVVPFQRNHKSWRGTTPGYKKYNHGVYD